MKELVKTNKKNMTITLYPDFMGYKRNGYEVDVEMQGHTAWVNHLMKKTWYKDNYKLQDQFDKNWRELMGKLKDYPGAEALTSNTATVGLNTDRGKGVTICKAKDCNNSLYGWTSSRNKEYCVDCV